MEPSRILDELARQVIGSAIEVHKILGPGYIESVYEEALVIELQNQGINYTRQPEISILYKENSVGKGRLDLLINQQLIVELKAVEMLLPIHKAQVISYLKATQHHLGLLINLPLQQNLWVVLLPKILILLFLLIYYTDSMVMFLVSTLL